MPIAIDIERPRWRAAEACSIAGIDQSVVRMMRKQNDLRIGKRERTMHRFSVLDIGSLSILHVLRAALGVPVPEAILLAEGELREQMKRTLINRLVHGFWSIGAVEIDLDGCRVASRLVYLDSIAERVITKLQPSVTAEPAPAHTGCRGADGQRDLRLHSPVRLAYSVGNNGEHPSWRVAAARRSRKLLRNLARPPGFCGPPMKRPPSAGCQSIIKSPTRCAQSPPRFANA